MRSSRHTIAIIGDYPPPLGGVSVHVERLVYHLTRIGLKVTVYSRNIRESDCNGDSHVVKLSKWWWLHYLVFGKDSIVHCHPKSWNLRFLISLLRLKGIKVVFTYHSLRQEWKQVRWTKKLRIKLQLKLATYNIAVNPKIRDKLIKWGAPASRVRVISGFLRPTELETSQKPPKDILEFIEGSLVIVANASRLKFFRGEDLYGIDMMLSLADHFRKDNRPKTLIYLGDLGDEAYYRALKRRIVEKKLQNNFKFVIGQRLTSIMPFTHLFIRPSNTDGFSISIMEALYRGVPVLASDTSERPKGVEVFRNRDLSDMVKWTKKLLENNTGNREHSRGVYCDPRAHLQSILRLYKLTGSAEEV